MQFILVALVVVQKLSRKKPKELLTFVVDVLCSAQLYHERPVFHKYFDHAPRKEEFVGFELLDENCGDCMVCTIVC